ncbi:MAG: hypothetical protein ACRDXC_12015, partial [Acidimicrobiales bacterium]
IELSPGMAESINRTVAVPLGLALNGPSRTRFELIPPEVPARRAARKRRRLVILGLAGLAVVLCAVSVARVLSVQSAEHQVAVLQSTIHTIETVELPRYDKAIMLGQKVTALQSQEAPLVSHEVDWLVVLNQLGEYLPSTAVLDGIDLTATTPTGGTAGSAPPASPTVIATGSTTVYTHTLTQVTQFGLTMAKSPALSEVDLSGAVGASPTSVSFPVSFSVTKAAHGQRAARFAERIP